MGIFKGNVSAESDRAQSGTTIIAEGNKFSGEMNVTGKMHIDGVFEGTINSLDYISVGKKGHVSGLIRARQIIVSGLLEGEITCEELHIEAGGEVHATVTSKEMSISPKGNFIGERKRWEQPAKLEKADKPEARPEGEEGDVIDSLPGKVVLNKE